MKAALEPKPKSAPPQAAPAAAGLSDLQGAEAGFPLFLDGAFTGGGLQRKCGCGGTCDDCRERIQTKLKVGAPDDAYEREADQVATQVMRMPDPRAIGTLQRSGARIDRKCSACEEEEEVQRKQSPEGGAGKSFDLDSYLAGSRGGGQPLSPEQRSRFEPRFGQDFSHVQLHNDGAANRAAHGISALAFTAGNSIHFAEGKYAPGTAEGDHLLAHELTHTVQQTGSRPLGGGAPDVSRAWDGQIQRWPSLRDVGGFVGGTVAGPLGGLVGDAAGGVLGNVWDSREEIVDTVQEGLGDAVDVAEEGLDWAGDRVGDAADLAEEGVDWAGEKLGDLGDLAGEGLDWITDEALELASELADLLGVDVTITKDGLVITVEKICPIDALTEDFDLPGFDAEFMVPLFAVPLGPIFLTGDVGLGLHVAPQAAIQLGPICLGPARVVVNPLTASASVSGAVSITAAASLGAEVRAGLRGVGGLMGIIPIGGVPVPIKVPVVGIEGGVVGMARAIGATTFNLGGSLGFSGGSLSVTASPQLDLGVAADLFAGAYAQLEIMGENVCRIYWEPYSWHGGAAASLGISLGASFGPSGISPTIGSPVFTGIPFSNIPLALSRKGFADDCPIKDRICDVLDKLGLLPSQNGGEWNWGGPYGPGARLSGPLEAYQKNPGIPSGAECRGACGPDCNTCEAMGTYLYTDPATGDVWEYTNFQDCNSNGGCREHDAAFDWAADVHGETGKWAIVMPWHMAANMECGCENVMGNCIAWIAGLPPYDSKMYFADTATQVASGGGSGKPAGGGACEKEFPGVPVCPEALPDKDAVLNAWGGPKGLTGFENCKITTEGQKAPECGTGPGNGWDCTATDTVTGGTVTVNIFECICCKPDDSNGSTWQSPGVAITADMTEEQILALCERNLIPRAICIPLEDNMIERFGNRRRDMNLDPDKDPKSPSRPDDAPIMAEFRKSYNRLDSWGFFIAQNHPDLVAEFDTISELEKNRAEWMARLKKATTDYKSEFRNLKNGDPAQTKADYEAKVLGPIRAEIDALLQKIAVWYQTKTGSTEPIADLIERVHAEGTEIWRAAWRKAILQVNRVLAILWPPARTKILVWIGGQRARNPGVDLGGSVSELDYIGSLATGFKGPPKQQIRFNPRKFDVDANLDAPPLAKWAMNVDSPRAVPDKGRIFARTTHIAPLIEFADAAQTELTAKVEGYDTSDKFDVVVTAPELPVQERQRTAAERLYELRGKLSKSDYEAMLAKLDAGGYLKGGIAVRDDLTEDEHKAMNDIMNEYAK